MLQDNPILTLLGRRGRGAVIDVLLAAPRDWSVRSLARKAQVTSVTASRTCRELEALAAVTILRPGRDAIIQWQEGSVAAQAIRHLRLPDIRDETATGFALAFGKPEGVHRIHRWQDLTDHDALPDPPTRIAVLCTRDTDAALDAVGPALDAVRDDGLPAPDVTVWALRDLHDDDPVAKAILAGTPI